MSKIVCVAVAALLLAAPAFATPSTTYWTPMTMDIQPFGVLHLGVDNYFNVDRSSHEPHALATDVGLTIGILPFEKLIMEVGVDGLYPSDFPYYFNAKLGTPEDSLFDWSPALEVGIFNIGTGNIATNQNVVYGVIGKTIPNIGRLSIGPYIGNSKALVDGNGKKENTGFMAAFDHGFVPTTDAKGNEYKKLVLAADYASGKNAIGGGGVGLYYYFTKDISLLTGPVFFNEKSINGTWKWTVQLDINF